MKTWRAILSATAAVCVFAAFPSLSAANDLYTLDANAVSKAT